MEQYPEDRSVWNRAWSSMPHREILTWHADSVEAIVAMDTKRAMKIVRVTISEDPKAFADKCFRPSAICPICGFEASAPDRVAASIHPVFELGSELAARAFVSYAVWVHAPCLDECPIIDDATPIPW